MADPGFSQQEIEDLARRLTAIDAQRPTTIDPPLSPRETQLLTAVFAAAAGHAELVGLDVGASSGSEIRNPPGAAGREGEGDLPDLHRQFHTAYMPGNEPGHVSTFKVFGVQIGAPHEPPPPTPAEPEPPPAAGNGG